MADAPSGWPQFARALRKQALMDEMMETQGVDLVAAVRTGEGFVKARANCRDCKDEGACRAWFLERSRRAGGILSQRRVLRRAQEREMRVSRRGSPAIA